MAGGDSFEEGAKDKMPPRAFLLSLCSHCSFAKGNHRDPPPRLRKEGTITYGVWDNGETQFVQSRPKINAYKASVRMPGCSVYPYACCLPTFAVVAFFLSLSLALSWAFSVFHLVYFVVSFSNVVIYKYELLTPVALAFGSLPTSVCSVCSVCFTFYGE